MGDGPPFVGPTRVGAVEALLDGFDAVSAGGPPQTTILVGPPGSGKTRIVQELFGRLPRTQREQGYWPARLVESEDWQEARKSLQPEGSPESGRPAWLWWAIECHEHDGAFAQSLFDDLTRLERQLSHVARRRAWRAVRESLDWLDYLLNGLSFVLISASAFGAGSRILANALTSIDRLLFLTGLVTLLIGGARRRRTLRQAWRLIRGSHVPEWEDGTRYGRRTEVERIVDKVVAASRTIPTIIVVDDAHAADETLVAFLEQVLDRPRARVLVVACAWPTEPDRNVPFAGWLESLSQQSDGRMSVVDLTIDAPLSEDDMEELIRAELVRRGVDPETIDEDVYRALLAKAEGNALAAVAQLQTAEAASLLNSGGLNVRSVQDLPTGLAATIQSYWRRIPDAVRSALALAAVIGRDFPDGPVAAGLAGTDLGPAPELLERASDRFRVIRAPVISLRRFVDQLYLSEAQRDATNILMVPPESLTSLANEVERLATARSLPQEPLMVQEVILAAHVRLALERPLMDQSAATRSAVALSALYAARSGFENALRYARFAEDLDPRSDDLQTVQHRTDRVRWLLATGASEEALRRASDLAILARDGFGAQSVESVGTELLLGEVRIATGRHLEALKPLISALTTARTLDQPPPELLTRIETQVAECHSRAGEFREAASILEGLALRLDATDGAPASEIITALLSSLKIEMRSGHRPQVIPALRTSIERADGDLGTDHPQSLRGRLLLVEALMTYRDPTAVDEGLRVVEHAQTVRPTTSVDVIRARIRACEALRALDDERLLAEAETVHRFAEQELGTGNPSTVRAFGVLADALIRDAIHEEPDGRGERWARAEEVCGRLLEQCVRTYGEDNADTLMVRRRWLRLLGATGRASEAFPAAEGLLERTRRIRGPEHPDALRTRALLLELRHRLHGSTADLEREELELVRDCARIMGSDHPMCGQLLT